MYANAFLSSIARKFSSMGRYEDSALHAAVLADVPLATLEFRAQERMRALQKAVRQDGQDDINVSIQEMLLLEVLDWFKNWMEWVDSPECDKCDSQTKFSHSSEDERLINSTGADRIEMFRCIDKTCSHMTPFERHSDPSRAWIAQRGRCGEWATAFTLLCRALKWEARLICDSTDHAWTEVYSVAQKRWLHTDPCENICDQPLIYETGWRKKLSYVIAYSHDDLQDVTWRYSVNHSETLKNRNNCNEIDLLNCVVHLRDLRQRIRFGTARRNYLAKRTAMELVELMIEKKTSEADNQGRTSGSLSWRLQRGETKVTNEKIWSPTNAELNSGQMTIRYSVVRDCYERTLSHKVLETVQKWENGVARASGLLRKEEKDWKMVYLAREESSAEGVIEWRFSAAGRKIRKVSVRCLNQTFENGQICLTLSCGHKTMNFSSSLETEDFSGADNVTVAARLSGGQGNCAWQHAQLFRQPLTDVTDSPFSVTVTFL